MSNGIGSELSSPLLPLADVSRLEGKISRFRKGEVAFFGLAVAAAVAAIALGFFGPGGHALVFSELALGAGAAGFGVAGWALRVKRIETKELCLSSMNTPSDLASARSEDDSSEQEFGNSIKKVAEIASRVAPYRLGAALIN